MMTYWGLQLPTYQDESVLVLAHLLALHAWQIAHR